MVPPGEVVLVLAGVGKGFQVISAWDFSAVVITVVMTITIAPMRFNWSLVGEECRVERRAKGRAIHDASKEVPPTT